MTIQSMRWLAIAAVLMAMVWTVSAATKYVWTNSPSPAGPYSTWETAAHDIQSAVTNATDGDIIYVTNGVYNVTSDIDINDAITLQSVNGATNTFVVGTTSNRCLQLNSGIGGAEATLDGFTITNGCDNLGGGIYIEYGGIIKNCIITGNRSTGTTSFLQGGGGAYLSLGGTLTNCIIRGNISDNYGGGVYFLDSGDCVRHGTIQNCAIDHNTAASRGGGIYSEESSWVSNSIISSNTASGSGGGIYSRYGITTRNCLIAGNNSGNSGGGIYFYSDTGWVENCTIVDNTANTYGGVCSYLFSACYTNTIIYNNHVTTGTDSNYYRGCFGFCLVSPLPDGPSNLDANPLFANGWRLSANSPCINSGSNQDWMTNACDLDGNNRIIAGIVDRGAYELLFTTCAVYGVNGAIIANGEAASADKGTDFGSISWGIALTNTLSITNSGTESLNISSVNTNGTGAAHFRVIGIPAIVSSDTKSNFNLIFSPSAGGAYTTAVSIANNSTSSPYLLYLAGTALKHDQTITNFPNPGTQTATNTVHLFAQASSGLQISNFTVAAGPAVISGLTNMTFTNSGSVTVIAGQDGDASWNAAPNVTNTFTVNKASQTIAFAAIADQVATSTVSLSAAASSGLAVSFAVGSGSAQISGGTNLSFTAAGIVSIIASQGGNSSWNPAPNITNTFTVSKAAQTITFPTIADQVVTSTVTLSATAGSGLSVSFAVGSGPASISDSTLLSFSNTGQVSIVASQSGNAIWNAAPNVTNSFNVIAVVATNLGVPQNIAASDGTYTGRVVVTWNAVSGTDGYEVWNSDVNNIGTASTLARSTTTNYNDTSAGARAGLMKYYWLRAWNTVTTGAFSAVDSGYALPDAGAEIISGQPAVGDYDGDGKADPAVYHLNSGRLYAWMSSALYSLVEPAIQFHVASGEIPAFGDYDGDGYIDAGVFRATAGTWYVWLSSAGYYRIGPILFGIDANDIPVAADYDGDRLADPAVYHGAEGTWYIWLSSAGYMRLGPLTQFSVGSTDIPAPGDYDGDGLADPAVYQPAGGIWYVWLSSAGYYQIGPVTFATSGEHLSTPADYDGDHICDPGAYIPSEGKWRMWKSGSGYGLTEMELR